MVEEPRGDSITELGLESGWSRPFVDDSLDKWGTGRQVCCIGRGNGEVAVIELRKGSSTRYINVFRSTVDRIEWAGREYWMKREANVREEV